MVMVRVRIRAGLVSTPTLKHDSLQKKIGPGLGPGPAPASTPPFTDTPHVHLTLKVMVMIGDCWISIRFVCFFVWRFVACDRPVSGNINLLVYLENNFWSSLRISLLHLLEYINVLLLPLFFRAKLGERAIFWFTVTAPQFKWLTEQKNLKSLRSLNKAQRDATNFTLISKHEFKDL